MEAGGRADLERVLLWQAAEVRRWHEGGIPGPCDDFVASDGGVWTNVETCAYLSNGLHGWLARPRPDPLTWADLVDLFETCRYYE